MDNGEAVGINDAEAVGGDVGDVVVAEDDGEVLGVGVQASHVLAQSK